MYAQVLGKDTGVKKNLEEQTSVYILSLVSSRRINPEIWVQLYGAMTNEITIIRPGNYSKINIGIFYFKSTFTINPQAVDLFSDGKFTCTEAI